MKKIVLNISLWGFLVYSLLPQISLAQPGTLDITFNPASAIFTQGVVTNSGGGSFYKSVAQPDGKILISGVINNYNGVTINSNNPSNSNIIRINVNGTLDLGFNNNGLAEGASPYINALAVQADGKIIIAGSFTGYDGVPGNHIMRLNTDGSVDNSFVTGTGFNNSSGITFLNSLLIQANGQIIASGLFNEYNGVARKGIARLNTDGSLDNSFDPGASINYINPAFPSIQFTTLQSDGKIILSGIESPQSNTEILRLNTDGSIDNSFIALFPTSTPHNFRRVFVQPDDKLIVRGNIPWSTGYATLFRLNADGSIDNGFSAGYTTGYTFDIVDIKFQADGKIILAGNFDKYGYAPDISNSATLTPGSMIRLLPNGTIDAGFTNAHGINTTGGAGIVWFVHVQTNQKIITGIDGFTPTSSYVKRLNTDGSLDVETGTGAGTIGADVRTMDIQADGKIIVGGLFQTYNGITRNGIARVNTDGSLDENFDPANSWGSSFTPTKSCLVQPDGKILIWGSSNGRANTDGTKDLSFNAGTFTYSGSNITSPSVTLLQPDGKIIVAGLFDSYDGIPIINIARLNNDGSLDASFNPGLSTQLSGTVGVIYSLAIQADGKVLIGGNFTSYNGVTRKNVARLNTDGSLDESFVPPAESFSGTTTATSAIKVQADGKVLIAAPGYFTYNNVQRVGIARLNADGSVDESFVPSPTTLTSQMTPQTISLQSDGKIILGGSFSFFTPPPGQPKQFNLARLNIDGSVDTSFNHGGTGFHFMSYPSAVFASLIQPDGKLLVAGGFNSVYGPDPADYNGVPVYNVARILPGCIGSNLPTISATATNITFPQNTTLSVATGNLNNATTWKWYSNSCGGTLVGTGNSITVAPNKTTAYYVRGEGVCVSPGACASITINVQSRRYYIHNGNPWAATDNQTAMNNVFGSGNWMDAPFTTDPATIFTSATSFIMIEGSNGQEQNFSSYLSDNNTLIENWVSNGGRLFINSAPNVFPIDINCGFNGTQINFNAGSGGSHQVYAARINDTIFKGPFTPIDTWFYGSSASHGSISGNDLNKLLMSVDGVDTSCLSYKQWGNGFAFFGSLTPPGFTWSPQPEANNFWYNLFDFVNSVTPCIPPSLPTISATSTSITFPQSTTLSIATGDLYNATSWKWYSNSCGGTLVGTGNSITVSPNRTTTYYVRGEGGCTSPGACASITINVQSQRYYIQNNDPWDLQDNQTAMNTVFGTGNWTQTNYTSANPATIFTAATSFVMMEGGSLDAVALNNYLSANNTVIENWVANGGRLFINSPAYTYPNSSDFNVNCGFSGTIISNHLGPPPSSESLNAFAANSNDSIFKGPYTPVATSFQGNWASHAKIIGNGLDTLLKGDPTGYCILANKQWGNGLAFFGTITPPSLYWTPQPQGNNFWYNVFDYVNSVSAVPYYILVGQLSSTSLCAGSNFSIPYTASGFTAGNIFTAQLSDPTGSFANPVTIGTINSNTNGTINATIASNTVAGTGYRIRITASLPNNTSVDNGVNLTITTPVTPSVSIALTNGNIPDCSGQPLTFTATPVNGGSNPVYQWKLNGNTNIGTNSSVLTYNSFVNGDVLTCTLTSNASCITQATTVSNGIIPVPASGIPSSVSIAITSGNNPDCSGDSITFTATPTNGGSSPTFQWFVNGNPVGTNANSYTVTSPSNNDAVTCIMTSSLSCANPVTASSNVISIKTAVTPELFIGYGSGTSTCASGTLQFYAVPYNGGNQPTFQWQLNGINVPGATSHIYYQTGFTEGDVITLTMTSSEPCATPAVITSSSAPITIYSVADASLNIGEYNTTHCAGAITQFYANVSHAGQNPSYHWTKNGLPAGINDSYYEDNTLITGDVISCSITTDPACATPITIQSSNNITVTINQPVTPTITIAAGNPVSSLTNIFTASITHGGANPTYEWKKNTVVVGNNSNTYIDLSLVSGDVITCTLNSDAPCAMVPIVTSNSITVQVLSYCTPVSIYGATPCSVSGWITNVLLGTAINHASGCGGFYEDYTTTDTLKTTAGQIINFTITEGSDGTNWGMNANIYIDYNQDGDFTDAGEKVADNIYMSVVNPALSSFVLPALLAPGSYRIRVMISNSNVSTSCELDYGEAEDYILQITQPVYCIPVISNPCDMWISNVTIGSINNSSIQPATCDAGGYTNYSSLLSALAAPGQPVNYSLSAMGNYYQYADIYVDYNSDGDFDDEGEHAAADIFMDYSGTPVTGSFIVPSLQAYGLYRMRVKSHSTLESQTGPCGNNINGETEDYTLIITCIPNGSDIVVKGNGVVINDGDNTPDIADFTDFGNVIFTTSFTRTFFIENPGTNTLNISGVTIDGQNPFYFTVLNQSATSILAGGSTSFTIQFYPTYFSVFSAVIHVNSDNCDKKDYDITIFGSGTCPPGGPDINVQGNGIDIPIYDNSPGVADNTDFGTVTSNNTLSKTFTIQNNGNQPLNITGAEAGIYNDPNQFVVTSQPAATVAPGDFTTFTVKFSPGGSGQKYSWIRIINDDCDESYFVFLVSGNAECPTLTPEINIKGNSIDIADGDDTPDVTDNTDFGTTPVNTSISKTFIIENTGADPLTISGITFTGINAADFSVTTAPAATVAPGNNTTFTIQLLPTTGGPKFATMHINNTDCDEGNYDFALKGNDSPCVPPNAAAGSDRTTCAGSATTIGAPPVPGSEYSWVSLPAGFTSSLPDPTVNPTVTTTYYLTETITATGCIATNSVTVTVNSLPATPTVTLLQPTCDVATGTITITAPTGMVSYTITGTSPAVAPITQAGLIFAGLAPGIYDVTTVNTEGCISATLSVTVKLDKAYWAGTIDDDWNKAGNWNTGQVPTASTHVFIPMGTPACRIRSADAHAASIQTQTGATLEVINNWKITIHGTCTTLPAN